MEDGGCNSVSKALVEGAGVEEVEPVEESVAEESFSLSSTVGASSSERNKLFRRFSSLEEDVLCDGKFVVSFVGVVSAAC